MSRTPLRKAAAPAAKGGGRTSSGSRAPARAPAGDAWVQDVVFAPKEPKLAVSLRLDADVLRFFRGFGSGYQTRINEVLRVFMNAHRGRAPDTGGRTMRRTRR